MLQLLHNQLSGTNDDDIFSHVVAAPPDPIFGITLAYKADTSDKKIDLGVGAYRTDDEKPYVFDIVRKVEKEIANDHSLNKEYLPIDGIAEFNKLSQQLMFGKDNPLSAQGRIVTSQSVGGTGALRVGFEFIKRHIPATIYISKPTWGNHNSIVERTGLAQEEYPYYDPATKGFNCKGMLDCLSKARMGSVVLLHVCAHNPTGVDPTMDQWMQIAEVCRKRRLVPFFDCAYQGFASGCIEKDVSPLRKFAELGFQMIVAQSYSKNMGLYGERVGAVHIVTASKDASTRVLSQLKIVSRTLYSNPPTHGARIVAKILGNEQNYQAWLNELSQVTGRVIKMRTLLKQELQAIGTPGNWDHITNQIGFFTFTGLTPKQCESLTKDYHIYLFKTGRMSMAGVSSKNVKYLAECIKKVVTAS